MSTWTDVPQAPLDPILGMGQRFQADTDPRKVNVSVGAYRTDEGKPLVLSCIKKAEARLLSDASLNKEYLPQRGDAEYNKLCQTMLFGDDSKLVKDGLLATAQTLSGTGALRLRLTYNLSFALPALSLLDTRQLLEKLFVAGALRLGAEFVKRYAKEPVVYVSSPTWGTHNSVRRVNDTMPEIHTHAHTPAA